MSSLESSNLESSDGHYEAQRSTAVCFESNFVVPSSECASWYPSSLARPLVQNLLSFGPEIAH